VTALSRRIQQIRDKQMQTTAHELRRAGVAIARTKEGFELPVIDVTHPRFVVADDPQKHQDFARCGVAERAPASARPEVPHALDADAMSSPDATFLDAVSTYVMK
jgi:hypothetical protein